MTYVILRAALLRARGVDKRLMHAWLPIIVSGLVLFSSLIAVSEFDSSDTLREFVPSNSEWRLYVGGWVSHALNLTFDELASMPNSTEYAELYCYDTFVVSGDWTGVKLGSLLERAGPTQQAGTIELYAEDGYKITLPFELAVQENTIVAFAKDGEPLFEKTRLVLPHNNGSEWISMITHIELVAPANPI